jgi:hypothetical protein
MVEIPRRLIEKGVDNLLEGPYDDCDNRTQGT